MKRVLRMLVPAALLLAGATGCGTFQTVEDADAQSRRIAALETNLRTIQENQQQIQAQLEELRQDNALSASQTKSLNEAIGVLDRRFDQVDTSSRQQLAGLQRKLDEESKLRTTAISTMQESVAKTLAKQMADLQKRLQKAISTSASATSSGAGQYEYVVQPGDTLTLIAKASGVSTSTLKRVNGLKSDTVRPGQKLAIPAPAGSTAKKKTSK